MALIFEFKRKLSVSRKPLPLGSAGTGKIVLFTGVQYERITSDDVPAVAKNMAPRKRSAHRRTRTIEALA
jgi:hypothetical protein